MLLVENKYSYDITYLMIQINYCDLHLYTLLSNKLTVNASILKMDKITRNIHSGVIYHTLE